MSVDPELRRSLIALGYAAEDVDEALLSPQHNGVDASKPLSALPQAVQEALVKTLDALDGGAPAEDPAALARDVRGIFAYGTLRADLTPAGDRWGVTPGCAWAYGRIRGFALYQNKALYYPFAVRTENEGDCVYGTLLTWPHSAETFAQRLSQCNEIEGYNPRSEAGLYQRTEVDVERCRPPGHPTPGGGAGAPPARAYVYYQDADAAALRDCLAFAEGDWLVGQQTFGVETDGGA